MYEIILVMVVGALVQQWVKNNPLVVGTVLRGIGHKLEDSAKVFFKRAVKERTENIKWQRETVDMVGELVDLRLKEFTQTMLVEFKTDELGRMAAEAREDITVSPEAHDIVDKAEEERAEVFGPCNPKFGVEA